MLCTPPFLFRLSPRHRGCLVLCWCVRGEPRHARADSRGKNLHGKASLRKTAFSRNGDEDVTERSVWKDGWMDSFVYGNCIVWWASRRGTGFSLPRCAALVAPPFSMTLEPLPAVVVVGFLCGGGFGLSSKEEVRGQRCSLLTLVRRMSL